MLYPEEMASVQDAYAKQREMAGMVSGRLGSVAHAGNYGIADQPTISTLTDRLGFLINEASETLSVLVGQHERLFGSVPTRPESINNAIKQAGPPTALDGISALEEYQSKIGHVARCIANRI